MSDDQAPLEYGELLASFRSIADYHREMGLDELLIAAGDELPKPPTREVVKSSPPANKGAVSTRANLEGAREELESLRKSLMDCTRCPLHEKRNHVVFGAGDHRARLVFVGEGPGAEEDRQGVPFVGAAGQLLDKIIQAIGIGREDVYICNVVKCRPPRNRTPLPDERATCGVFLERQLELINPEVIVALGATAANHLLETETSMSRLRGRFHSRGSAVVMPTYHPAYLLRTPTAKRAVWEDMKQVRDRLGLPS